MSRVTEKARAHHTFLWTIFVVLVPALVACGSGPVGRAEARWQAAAVDSYRLHLREIQSVWCVYEVDLQVQGGHVVSATVVARPGPAQGCLQYTQGAIDSPVSLSPKEAPAHWTVPGMFEIARDWQGQAGQKGLRVELEFDPELGYPRRIYRDDEQALDDDWGLSVGAFEILPRGAAE